MSELDDIRARLEPALFHAPYIADGRKVVQANNHPAIAPYMLSDNSMPVIAEFIANAPTDMARLLAIIEEQQKTLHKIAELVRLGTTARQLHEVVTKGTTFDAASD